MEVMEGGTLLVKGRHEGFRRDHHGLDINISLLLARELKRLGLRTFSSGMMSHALKSIVRSSTEEDMYEFALRRSLPSRDHPIMALSNRVVGLGMGQDMIRSGNEWITSRESPGFSRTGLYVVKALIESVEVAELRRTGRLKPEAQLPGPTS